MENGNDVTSNEMVKIRPTAAPASRKKLPPHRCALPSYIEIRSSQCPDLSAGAMADSNCKHPGRQQSQDVVVQANRQKLTSWPTIEPKNTKILGITPAPQLTRCADKNAAADSAGCILSQLFLKIIYLPEDS